MSSRKAEKERLREERLAREAAGQHRAARRRRFMLAGGGTALAVLVTIAAILVAGGGDSSSSGSPSAGSRLLASAAGAAGGSAVDGIQCQTNEQALFHIHAHLTVYVDGHRRLVPEGIGIAPPRTTQPSSEGPFVSAGSCFYWLHSHTRDGIVHIESPVKRVYTLGNYFDVWNQPLSADQVGPSKGQVTAYVNGRRFKGDPRSIPLKAHGLIQLDVGAPVVAPARFVFPGGL